MGARSVFTASLHAGGAPAFGAFIRPRGSARQVAGVRRAPTRTNLGRRLRPRVRVRVRRPVAEVAGRRYASPMRDVLLARSPVAPGRTPVRVAVRDEGAGPPLVLLHGGWGYEAYPWDLARLAAARRVIAPDRTGYGRSGRVVELPPGFHQAMAEETLLVLDALRLERFALWGHSDGAVIAAWTALLAPARVERVVLEALHFRAAKPGSLPFFETARDRPEAFGEEVVRALERDHGPAWREVIGAGGRAWLAIIAEGLAGRRSDLFGGRLGAIAAPVLLLHGSRDPRTEPGELDDARRALPGATLALLDSGHAPHASARTGAEATLRAIAFLDEA